MAARQAVGRDAGREAGLSLIELAVAIAVLSIALVGAMRMLGAGIDQADGERERLLAQQVALNRAAEIRAGLSGLADTVALGGRDWTVTLEELPTEGGFARTTILVRPQRGGAGAALTVWRDPQVSR